MNINELISIIKKKLQSKIVIQNIEIEDKSYLHKKHSGHQEGRFHLKMKIDSIELSQLKKIESNKKIYTILNNEIKEYIHSIQILIN